MEDAEENNLVFTGYWLNVGPTVHAGPDQTAGLPDATIVLEGTASDDGLPLGAELAATWRYVSGPIDPAFAPPLFAVPHTLATTATLPMPGAYLLMLEVSDSRWVQRDYLTVTVHPANGAPLVSAGPDLVVELPEKSVLLAGSVADDALPPGGTTQSAWTVVTAAGPVSFADPASASTTATLSVAGTHVLRLTATMARSPRATT